MIIKEQPHQRRKPQVHRDHHQHKHPAGAGRLRGQVTDQKILSPLERLQQPDQRLIKHLRPAVHHHPVTRNADQPRKARHHHARNPGQPARPAETIHEKCPPAVQQRRDHRRPRSIAVQGAHHPPYQVGFDPRHSLVRGLEAELVEHRQVHPRGQDNQQQKDRDRAGVIERVEFRPPDPFLHRPFQYQRDAFQRIQKAPYKISLPQLPIHTRQGGGLFRIAGKKVEAALWRRFNLFTGINSILHPTRP